MIRRSTSPLVRCCAAIFSAALGSGCALLNDHQESVIRVESSRNTVNAQRQTLAGVKAMNTGHLDYAFDRFIQAIAADETYGPAHNNIGLLHYDRGELYDAVLSFERATELMPGDPIVFYNLGLTLEAAGRVHEALDLYWQAVEMDPTNPNFLGNLVRMRVRLGENSPEVVAQLQDLILIETRPDWRRWADRQLALDMNDALDRGPDAPEFEMGSQRGQTSTRPKSVIDLTPPTRSEVSVPLPPSPGMIESKSRTDRVPAPLQDSGSLETLPPSIQMIPDPNSPNGQ
jgi:Flp pilus assembly protein TadD